MSPTKDSASTAQPPLPEGYALHPGYPSVPDYLHLRAASGLAPKTAAQAAPVASGSWYGCYITFTPRQPQATTTITANNNNTPSPAPATSRTPGAGPAIAVLVAMGRIIGDGGWYFHIADMAVLPEHQRKGLGDAVLRHLLGHIRAHAPSGEDGAEQPYITLLADEPGRRLYRRHGFVETMPRSMGMMLPMGGSRGP